MTENEARTEIEKHIQFLRANWKPHPDYRVIDALNEAIQALEKQIPKTVYHFVDDDTFEVSCCGFDVSNKDYKYCPECGQLLGGVEEVREDDGE